ncbi:MAG TPA: TlpA family protein disulfide reductase [Myxococcales bacterium]|nr:TlpA family protein disulfide reductase [Myxococcales bacterium]
MSLAGLPIGVIVRRTVVVLLVCLMIWVLGTALGVFSPPSSMYVAAGDPLPEFDLATARNREKRYSLADLKGKGLLLNFYGKACRPCEQEIPILRRIYKRYNGENFRVLGVTSQETRLAASFLKYHKIPWPTLTDRQVELRGQMGVSSFPTTIFVGADGLVAGIHTGPLDWKTASAAVEQLIISVRAKQKKASSAAP